MIRVALITALAVIAIRCLYGLYISRSRPLDIDETEFLHAGWLMKGGLRLYRDFVEDHAPFLFWILKSLTPGGSLPHAQLVAYASRARAFSAACGVSAVCCLAWYANRASGTAIAAIITITVVVTSPGIWLRAIADVRNDPPALLLFWGGALLIAALPRRVRSFEIALASTGIALVAVAALWNPKWPAESVVLGAAYVATLWRGRDIKPQTFALALAPGAAILITALGFIVWTVGVSDYLFYTFRYNAAIMQWITKMPLSIENGKTVISKAPPGLFCPDAFKGIWVVLALSFAIVLLVSRRVRLDMHIDTRRTGLLVMLALAAAFDIRFVYPYPNAWSQYYLMWAFIMAALYGVTISAALVFLPQFLRSAVTIGIMLVAVFLVDAETPRYAVPDAWPFRTYVQRQLRANQTVWAFDYAHPVAAPDASYYWFAPVEMIPSSLAYVAAHPADQFLRRVSEEDLPPCRAERGEDPHVRFVSGGRFLAQLPQAERCLQRMIASKRAVRTPVPDLWDLQPPLR
jgi:hypothetical protein